MRCVTSVHLMFVEVLWMKGSGLFIKHCGRWGWALFWILKCPQAFDNVASEASMWFSRLSLRLRPACAKEDTCSGCWPWPLAETKGDSGLKWCKLEIKWLCMTLNSWNYLETWQIILSFGQRFLILPKDNIYWKRGEDPSTISPILGCILAVELSLHFLIYLKLKV